MLVASELSGRSGKIMYAVYENYDNATISVCLTLLIMQVS